MNTLNFIFHCVGGGVCLVVALAVVMIGIGILVDLFKGRTHRRQIQRNVRQFLAMEHDRKRFTGKKIHYVADNGRIIELTVYSR